MQKSKLAQLSAATTLAMVRAVRQYALDRHATPLGDDEITALLDQHGGSMVKTLGHIEAMPPRRCPRREISCKLFLQHGQCCNRMLARGKA